MPANVHFNDKQSSNKKRVEISKIRTEKMYQMKYLKLIVDNNVDLSRYLNKLNN